MKGLYAITDSRLIPPGKLCSRVAQAIAGGAALVQYRDKQRRASERLREATALAALCRQHAVPLIINDDLELAAAVDAAGVHLGMADAAPGRARERLGETAIIGVSCYNRLERASEAVTAGADYIAFGRFFPSASKPEAEPATPALLREARARYNLPLVAIGGITPANGRQLIEAGADLLAVIHGVFGQPDVRAAAQAYAALFREQTAVGSEKVNSEQ
ncbi:MAG: thiamine phosphate synthase [Gammaproteobacteria bacterium]|jgi:thiamine-phosphate pyrophosphorylase